MLNYQTTVQFITHFIFWSIITFQMPIVLLILLNLKLVSRKTLWSISRYVVVIIFVFSALITPPDIFSLVSFALPLIGLYFLTLVIAYLFKMGSDNV